MTLLLLELYALVFGSEILLVFYASESIHCLPSIVCFFFFFLVIVTCFIYPPIIYVHNICNTWWPIWMLILSVHANCEFYIFSATPVPASTFIILHTKFFLVSQSPLMSAFRCKCFFSLNKCSCSSNTVNLRVCWLIFSDCSRALHE